MERKSAADPISQSADIVSENIEKLKQLFPSVFTEGNIDFEALKDILGDKVETDPEYYRFTWPEKAMAKEEARKPSRGTLRPAKDESVNWDTTQNLYIEGDNLEVLKLLQKSYANKVKMIYIDPPYNTGKDFVYKDNYKDNLANYNEKFNRTDKDGNLKSSAAETNQEGSARYHSDWLNMMYPRLTLARNLLTDDGVFFMSIDDNEVENLKKLCSEIFGEENFLGMFIVNSSPSGIDYGHLAKTNDYALFFSKNIKNTKTNQLEEKNKKFSYSDENGGYNLYPLYNGNSAFNDKTRPNLIYPFYLNPSNNYKEDFYEISVDKKENWIEIFPVVGQKDGIQRVWRWGKPKSKENLNDEIVGFKNNRGEFRIVQKSRLTTKVIRSLQLDNEVSSRRGTLEIESLLGKKVFSYPKPSRLIRRFCEVGSDKDSIILDFFSGSASTAHAIMALNAEDGGCRKYIQIQLPETTDEKSEAYKSGYTTIPEIGKERIRRAGKKILEENPEQKDKLDIGFKVFKLDESNIKTWETDPEKLDSNLLLEDVIKSDRTEEDVLYEILLKYGLDLTLPIQEKEIDTDKLYAIGGGALLVYLGDNATPAIGQEIINWAKELGSINPQAVFKDSGFHNSQDKVNTLQLLKSNKITDVWSI